MDRYMYLLKSRNLIFLFLVSIVSFIIIVLYVENKEETTPSFPDILNTSCDSLCWYDIVLNQTTKKDLYGLRHLSKELKLKNLVCKKDFDFSEYCKWREPVYGLEALVFLTDDVVSILRLSWREEIFFVQDVFDQVAFPDYYARACPGRHGERDLRVTLFYEDGLIVEAYQNLDPIAGYNELSDFQVTELYYVPQDFMNEEDQVNSNNELFEYLKRRLMFNKRFFWPETGYPQFASSECD